MPAQNAEFTVKQAFAVLLADATVAHTVHSAMVLCARRVAKTRRGLCNDSPATTSGFEELGA